MCVCVCVSAFVVAKWVGLRVHVFGFSVQGKCQCVAVCGRVVTHGVSEVTPNKKNSDLAVVSVCVYLVVLL